MCKKGMGAGKKDSSRRSLGEADHIFYEKNSRRAIGGISHLKKKKGVSLGHQGGDENLGES